MKVKVGDLLLLKSKGENEEHICGFLIHSFSLLFLLRSSILFIGYFAQFISLTGEGGVFSTIFKRNSAKVKTRLKLHWRHKTQEKHSHLSLCLKLTPIIRGGSFQTPVNFLGMHFK